MNGKSLFNLPYNQSLAILQNTGKTVELTVSQIYKKCVISSKPVSNVQPAKTSTVRAITRTMKNSFKFKKDRKVVETGKSNGDVTEKLAKKSESSRDAANWNCKNEKSSTIKMRSMPDLPKVSRTELCFCCFDKNVDQKNFVVHFFVGRRNDSKTSNQ